MRCMFLFYFDGADEFETCDDKMGRLCEPGTPCFAIVFGVSINLFFSRASGLLWSHPRRQRCGLCNRGLPALQCYLVSREVLAFQGLLAFCEVTPGDRGVVPLRSTTRRFAH